MALVKIIQPQFWWTKAQKKPSKPSIRSVDGGMEKSMAIPIK